MLRLARLALLPAPEEPPVGYFIRRMLESIRVMEKLHWPQLELAKKSVLSAAEEAPAPGSSPPGRSPPGRSPPGRSPPGSSRSASQLPPAVLKDTFTTGTSSYNVLLQSREERWPPPSSLLPRRSSSAQPPRCGKPSQAPCSPRRELRQARAPGSGAWCCLDRQPAAAFLAASALSGPVALPDGISVTGSSIPLTPKSKCRVRRRHFSPLLKPKPQPPPLPPQLCRSFEKDDSSGKKMCILTAIKPTNLEKEKLRFFKSDHTYNPQFEYANPALPSVLAKHSNASDRFLPQAINILELTLQKYGSYEKFEQATGGSLLSKTRIWSHVRKYMMKEGCLGEVVVHLTEDLLSRASMTVVNGCPTLTINVSTAREHWLEGMLRHEIGTHYFRGMNNLQQPWGSWTGRRKLELKPNNPTEEGLASIHSVLFRKDPFLWRAALLYYTVFQASRLSFCQLFQDIGKFVKDANTRWDYCVRAKRGCTDTALPGCFSKDQVYLDGVLQLLRHRHSIDFLLLTVLGKVSYEDVDRLKELGVTENMRVPQFLLDRERYLEHLEKIMEVNELTDKELRELIC